jgi:uncharacterized protein (DUF2267 family)
VTRTARYQGGRLEGLRYRLAGRHPDPTVEARVLADRVRSALGPVEHRLDIPRVHVMADGHDVLLHGDVASAEQAETLVAAVQRIPGVKRVESHLHVGLFPGDTRPSEGGEHRAPSRALTAVLAAAHGGGALPGSERSAARAVLSTFVAQLPRGERRHFLCHLPEDLRALVEEPRPRGAGHPHVRRLEDFVAAVGLPPAEREQQEDIVASVLGAVRELVPEEAFDVAAVLAPELRQLWKTAIPH